MKKRNVKNIEKQVKITKNNEKARKHKEFRIMRIGTARRLYATDPIIKKKLRF